MSRMKKLIDELNDKYREVSEINMRYLCARAKVEYQDYSEVDRLIHDLNAGGFIMEIRRYTKPDKSVGQTLVLRSQKDRSLISGYHVWIDLKNYTVKEEEINEADLDAIYGAVH